MSAAPRVRVPHVRDGFIVANVGIERSSTVLFVFAITVATAILYRFPPDRYAFYPLCPIHEYLHIDCPGCGATRAFAALLHGHLTDALRFNAFAVLVLLPLALAYGTICFQRSLKNDRFRWPTVPRPVVIALITVAAVFTVARDL